MPKDTPDPEARRVLQAVPYFASLDAQAIDIVAKYVSAHRYEAGQLVILEGEPATGLYVVQSGWLKVSKMAVDGREQILQFLENGDTFNAVSIFTGAPNPATVTALEPTRLWIIARPAMLRLLDTEPRIARPVIQDLAGRIMHLITLVEDLSLRTVEARLARLLLEQASGDVIQRKKWATQAEMASRLGTVPDVVSRTLRRLAERQLIQIDRQTIRILDRAELEATARVEV